MTAKLIEVRDRLTFIPMLAVKLDASCEAERYLLARLGFGKTPQEQGEYVLLCDVGSHTGEAHYDPYDWCGARTKREAHKYVIDCFDSLAPGDVVDVQFLMGETDKPVSSERPPVTP